MSARHRRRSRSFALAVALTLLAAVFVEPAAAQFATEPAHPEARIEQKLDAQVPLDLRFRDEASRETTLRAVCRGRPVVLVLAWYRCPRLCSEVLNGLVEGLRGVEYNIGDEFDVVTVSIDPDETPELAAAKKQAYVEQYGRPGAAHGWHFLTGEEPAIRRLAETVGFRYFYDADRREYAHAAGVMVLTPQGKVARYFYGIRYAPRDLSFGLEDASAGRIGSPVTQPLRLLCFGYDPVHGRYTFLTLRLVRIGGVVTVCGLASALVLSWLRERRRGRARPEPPRG